MVSFNVFCCETVQSLIFFFALTVFFSFATMNRPAPVEITYESMRFLITHNPTNATLNKFTEVRRLYSGMFSVCLNNLQSFIV